MTDSPLHVNFEAEHLEETPRPRVRKGQYGEYYVIKEGGGQ